jgi:hypothetical protein
MRIRKFRGQSVAEFLLSFIWVWAMLLLVLGVCDMWNGRVLAVHAAIDGACKEQMSPGYGVSSANALFNKIWPGQAISASTVKQGAMSFPDEPIFLRVSGNFVISYLVDTFGKFLPNSAFVSGSAGCPAQEFKSR